MGNKETTVKPTKSRIYFNLVENASTNAETQELKETVNLSLELKDCDPTINYSLEVYDITEKRILLGKTE